VFEPLPVAAKRVKHLAERDIKTTEREIDDRERMAAYLLGEMPPEEQDGLEREYLCDDKAYERLLVVEDELAYDYVADRLSPARRREFEATIGATEQGKRNVEFARVLVRALRESQSVSAGRGRYWVAAVAAGIVLAAVLSWLAVKVSRLNEQVAALQAPHPTVVQLPPPVQVPVEAAFLLLPGQSRSGGETAPFSTPKEASALRLELVLPPGAAPGNYAVAILTKGTLVWSGSAAADGPSVKVALSAHLLQSGEYEVSLRRLAAGEQPPELARYWFRLERNR